MAPGIELASLLDQLRDDLGFRRIEQGRRRLHQIADSLSALDPLAPKAAILLGLVAQWIDAGFAGPELLARLLARFTTVVKSLLPLVDYLHLRMAEAELAMAAEEFETAATHLRVVLSLEGEFEDHELLAIANFWTSRCLRQMGRYDDALNYTVRAEELALECGYLPMAAIMQMSRSWLAFQKGKLHDALTILHRAEEALSLTDDYLNRGNVQSSYGRIARRQGRYERALECFDRAIAEYREGGGGQLQLARALLNIAFVKRLLALEKQKEIDRAAASRRTAGTPAAVSPDSRAAIEHIRAEARANLDEAMAIYAPHNNHRGMAGVRINSGFLHLDSGDLECAALEAADAFRVGEEIRDHIVMARARILQAVIENAALDEQIGDPARHHEAAEIFARDAVSYAGLTQNRRLLARAVVWQGITLAAEPDPDLEGARACCHQAMSLLESDASERQYVWDELESLKARVLHARAVDPTLRAWSAGVVENRTFQQMTEEFARIVIPKVWEREGKKISRVAEKLSISPKKVRRILKSAGLVEGSQEKDV